MRISEYVYILKYPILAVDNYLTFSLKQYFFKLCENICIYYVLIETGSDDIFRKIMTVHIYIIKRSYVQILVKIGLLDFAVARVPDIHTHIQF